MTPNRRRNKPLMAVVCCLGLMGARSNFAQQATPAQPTAQTPPPPAAAPSPTPNPTPSSTPSPAPPVTTFKVTTREVQLDVVVVDANGHPVTGLKPSDFVVLEDGAPQTLKSMEEHGPLYVAGPASTNPTPPLPPNTFTNFAPVTNKNASTVLLLDALDSPIEAQMYLREQVIKYMKTVPAGNPIAIFQLDTQMRLIQGFTSDPEVLLNAVNSKRNMPKLSPLLSDHRNEVYRRYRLDILNQGLKEMGTYLASYPGRKSLIWFTGSIPHNVYGSTTPFRDSMRFPDDANLTGADVSADELSAVSDELTLSRVAVYPIDSRGLQTDPRNDVAARGRPGNFVNGFGIAQNYDHTELDEVAKATGGKAYYNTNGIKSAITEIVNNGSHYYTMAYATTNTNWDGGYRHIKVSVTSKAAGSGLSIQYRHGYYAKTYEKRERRQLVALQKRQVNAAYNPDSAGPQPPPDGAVVHPPKQGFDASMALGAVPPTELIFNASVAPASAVKKIEKNSPLPPDNYLRPEYLNKPYREYHILYLADAHKVKLTRTPDGIRHGQLDFVAVVYANGGDVVNTLKTSVELTLTDASYRRMLENGFGMRQVVAIPAKGDYFLRLGLRDATGDQVGALEIPVDQVKLGVAGAGQTLP